MLSDVGNLWFTASTAIAQALEKLDTDIGSTREGNDESFAKVNDDLETYKKLLDDAQMQHLELSKQSRLLLAEKDAEIQHLKKQLAVGGGSDGNNNDTESDTKDSSLLLQKALSERIVLESSLRELEDQLRDAMHAKNELQVLTKSYDELKKRYDIMKDDYSKLRQESEVLEKQRTETIENLASEYSRLAAEAEMIKQRSDARVAEVIKENEVLVTKMHALEHSITELADRASNTNPSPSPKRTSNAGSLLPPSSPSSSAPAPLSVATDDSAPAPLPQFQDNPALLTELKEAKAKLVNVQFDLKQRDDEIVTLKTAAQLAERTGHDQAATLQKKLQQLEEEKAQHAQQVQAKVQEVEQLQQQIRDLQQRAQENASAGEVELTSRYEAQIAEGKAQVAALESSLQQEQQRFVDRTAAMQSDIDRLQQQLVSLQTDADSLRAELATKEAALIKALQDARDEKQALEVQLAALQTASCADKDAATQQFIAKITGLEEELQAAKRAKDTLLQEHEAEKTKWQSSLAETLAATKTEAEQAEQEHLQALQTKLEAQFTAEKVALEEQIQGLEAALADAKAEQAQAAIAYEAAKAEAVAQERATVTQQLQEEHAASSRAAEDAASQRLAVELAAQVASHENVMKLALEKMQQDMIADKDRALDALTATHQTELQNTIQRLQDEARVAQEAALAALREETNAEKQAALQALIEAKAQELEVAIQEAHTKHQEALETLRQEKEQEVQAIQAAMNKIQEELQVVEAKHEAKLQASLADVEARKEAEKAQAIQSTRTEMQGLVDRANAERDEHLANYTKERVMRKRIHNKLLEIQGNIRVICRIRPINDIERRTGEDVDVTEIINEDEFYVQRDSQMKTKFEYDRVFGQQSTQSEVFEAVQPLCVSVLDGYNVCIFAYGQTGSGKTFTMEGYGDPGVTPRAMMELFRQVDALAGEWTYTLTLSILEIYNESIHDLLNNNPGKDKEKLDIRQTPDGNVVAGLTEVPISSMDQVNDLMRQGKSNRAVGKHDMNEHSSRSHSIVTVTVRGQNRLDSATTFGKLHLIDLAGSERISKTDATGDRLKEAQNINKSLLALGDVINALGNKKSLHVPYRNSKLTFLLQDSLGGNSKMLMFVNISPAVYNLGETVCSLNFASKCRSTELGQAKKQTGPAGEGGGTETSAAKQLLSEKRRALMSPSASQSNLLTSSSSKK